MVFVIARAVPSSHRKFHRILRNPVYCGWFCLRSAPGSRIKGLHRPIVTEDLFNRVQDVLEGKKPVTAARRKVNPDFPLKHFVRCGICGTPLTACFSRSKNGKLYGYYYCYKPSCRAVKSVAKRDMESAFEAMLGRLRPAPEILLEFPKIAAEVWQEQQGSTEKQKRKLTAKLEDQKKLKSELLRAKLKGQVEQADYEQGNAEFTREIAETERALRETDAAQANSDAFLRFAELQLLDVEGAWLIATPEERERVRNLLFQDGLT
jgi:site-specific DNA recombinase